MIKPKLLMSKCFFEAVRYDGGKIVDPLVERLKPFFDVIVFCPEADFGLGIPRLPIKIHRIKGERHLIEEKTGRNLTHEIKAFWLRYLSTLPFPDGALLKSKSPSCGVGTAKLYEGEKIIGKTDGLFADTLREVFPYLPLEDEGRLRDKSLYYHFLTATFLLARFRAEVTSQDIKSLLDFHSKAKYLLKTYNEELAKKMGKLLADKNFSVEEKFNTYQNFLRLSLRKKPDKKRHVNTLYHLAGHFTKRLSSKERHHLLSLIEKYRAGLVDLTVPLKLIKSLALRFEDTYVLNQIYLEPFPSELRLPSGV